MSSNLNNDIKKRVDINYKNHPPITSLFSNPLLLDNILKTILFDGTKYGFNLLIKYLPK